ncbi:WbqC family protein [Nocardiopsis sp. Huas11]|uniref:WbqC family protein n=1 Tax=Nocardiopsis sp. Huas11 TaxID=2183912 RepID=UPI000EB2FFCF|nr:WbqC family protein [Nocardiopsis sp. Huas11]
MNSDDTGTTRVAIHQPHYLPWLGLIDKIDRSDRFVFLDTVQFERRGWQNRNYVAGRADPILLTVPVTQGHRSDRIVDKYIDTTHKWRRKHYKALAEHCYRNAPYWDDYAEDIFRLYESEWKRVADLAIATTRLLLRGFGITTPLLRASEIGDLPGTKSELLARICSRTGADTLLSGSGSKDYLEPEILRDHGVAVEWQDFRHPVYRQHSRGRGDFVPRLSALDLLLNAGPDALHVLRRARAHA